MVKEADVKGTIFKIKRFSVHDGPGIRTAVFLKGCPLNCIWCHSPEGITSDISIWHNNNICIGCGKCADICPNKALELTRDKESIIKIDRDLCRTSGECIKVCPTGALQYTGYLTTVTEVMCEIEKDILYYKTSGGGITLTGGEPLFQTGFSIEILKACKEKKIHTAIETSLFAENEIVKRISDYVDLFITDMKIFDPAKHELYTGKPNKIIKENLIWLANSGKEIIVRIPLIENITDTEENKNAIIGFIRKINDKIPVEFIPYNPLSENNYKRLDLPFFLKKR